MTIKPVNGVDPYYELNQYSRDYKIIILEVSKCQQQWKKIMVKDKDEWK